MKKLLVLILALMPLVSSAQFFGNRRADDQTTTQLQKFNQFYQYLTSTYIEEVDTKKLIETAIKEALAELDPHSTYLSEEEMKAATEQFAGNFSGIGVEFNVLNDTIIIVNTVAGGPSEKVGVMPNDKIIAIDGERAIGMTREDTPKKLRGPRGSAVTITVVRTGVAAPLDFRIIRDNIPITTVDAAYKVDERTGYLKVNRFAQNTMDEFRSAIKDMGKIDALIVDLRGNGGGFLHMATDMSNYFLDRGDLIVSTEGQKVRPEVYEAPNNGEFTKGKVIVLIDEFSASASEIVSGALQDWDRAVIVGRRSFGKGLVQRQYPLMDGSAVRITISKYLTPTGRAIQRPFEMGHSEDYYQEMAKRLSANAEEIQNDTMQVYKTLRLGKTVYGGGGIYPDYYVAADTTGYSDYLGKLSRMGVMNEFLVSYLDHNRTSLESRYPDFETFERDFMVDDSILKELTDLAQRREIPLDTEGLEASKQVIQTQIKAQVAGRLWSQTEFYRIVNRARDNEFNKALEIIRNWDSMAEGIAMDR